MEKEYSEEIKHIELCLRVCGYNVKMDFIELILEMKDTYESLGEEMTIRDMLQVKKQCITDES
tara:strand:+ start:126 stop:314 length:189 start_codon:yes stop_codon:yes gene_type:complete